MRAKEFLLEYNREITLKNYVTPMFDRWYREGANRHARIGLDLDDANEPVISRDTMMYYVDQLLQRLENIDPTPNKEYVQWLARTYSKGGVMFEDVLTQVAQELNLYHALKRRRLIPAPYNDINRIPDFHSFDQIVVQYENQLPADDSAQQVDKGQAKEVYRDSQIRVINPVDQAAACYYGRGTRWCTAATNTYNAFSAYARKGPLYIIIPAQPEYVGEKYQFHFSDMQFMDEKDQPVQDLHRLVERYPQLMKLFGNEAKEKGILQFFYSSDDMHNIIKLLFPKVKEPLRKYFSNYRSSTISELSKAFLSEFPELRSVKVELAEIVADDVDASFDYYYRAILEGALQDPAVLYSEDHFYDMTVGSDRIREFSDNSGIFEFIQDILDADEEEVNFEVDQVLNGELVLFYSKAFRETWSNVTKQYLKI